MYKQVSFNDFYDEFQRIRPDSFSYDGLRALFDMLEDIEDYELDVIAIDCEYCEDSLSNVLDYYNLDSFDDLQEHTWAVMVDSENVIHLMY